MSQMEKFFFTYNNHYQDMSTACITLTPDQSLQLASPLDGSQWMHIFADWPILVCLSVGIHSRTLLMSLSLLLQQCPTCLTGPI